MKKRFAHKKNILLVNITRLGDMLQATPTIAGMKAENPGCKITVLVEKQFEDVCHFIPNIDEVMSLDLGMTCRAIAREQDGIVDAFEYLTETVEKLRAKNFDYCLNMSSSAYTAILLRLIGIERNGGWTADSEGYRVIESDWARLFATSVFHQNRQYNSLNLVDVFRCSADIDEHPKNLLIKVENEASDYAGDLIAEAGFTNNGPLIAIQSGASQGKRQWSPELFIECIKQIESDLRARIILTGSTKEKSIIDPIIAGCASANVVSFAGRTTIPQLAAVLKKSQLLITGDTGPMHMSVAVGTPVIAMFLASAFGFETGPYSEGNLVLQPVIGCGPCNPNKPCARPDCHETINPALIAQLTRMRLQGDVTSLPPGFADPNSIVIYRSYFDEFGFCDLQNLNGSGQDPLAPYRRAYRALWLDDLGGFNVSGTVGRKEHRPSLSIVPDLPADAMAGLDGVIAGAEEGERLIKQLVALVEDPRAPAAELGKVNASLSELDRNIEQIGFHNAPLGPVTRMFVFAKENIAGTDVHDLASQMSRIYQDLGRRARKFGQYLQGGTSPSVR